MFLVDDLLLSPVKGLAAICRKVEEAARQDLENQEKQAMADLGQLHQRLETGQIDEASFDAEESRLLEKIEEIAKTLHHRGESDDRDEPDDHDGPERFGTA
jgi:hypothetical protein